MRVIARLASALALLWFTIVARTAWRLSRPRRHWRPTDWAPSPLPLRATDFGTSDGIRLRGWIAAREQAPATAVCVHGWGTNHTEMDGPAHELYQRGFSVLLFDFRASGESGGTFNTGGVLETRDLHAAIDLAASDPELGGKPVVVLANSMGASVSLVVVAERDDVKAVFSDAAFASTASAIASGFRSFTGLPTMPFQRSVVSLARLLSRVGNHDLSAIEAISGIAPCAVLIAQGGRDDLVSPGDAHALYARAAAPKDLWIVPEAGHVVGAHVDRATYIDRVAEFFQRAVDKEPAGVLGPG